MLIYLLGVIASIFLNIYIIRNVDKMKLRLDHVMPIIEMSLASWFAFIIGLFIMSRKKQAT